MKLPNMPVDSGRTLTRPMMMGEVARRMGLKGSAGAKRVKRYLLRRERDLGREFMTRGDGLRQRRRLGAPQAGHRAPHEPLSAVDLSGR
jgi:hypothetical protein